MDPQTTFYNILMKNNINNMLLKVLAVYISWNKSDLEKRLNSAESYQAYFRAYPGNLYHFFW